MLRERAGRPPRACQPAAMLYFLLISLALLVCNAIYCARKMVADFKGSEPPRAYGACSRSPVRLWP